MMSAVQQQKDLENTKHTQNPTNRLFYPWVTFSLWKCDVLLLFHPHLKKFSQKINKPQHTNNISNMIGQWRIWISPPKIPPMAISSSTHYLNTQSINRLIYSDKRANTWNVTFIISSPWRFDIYQQLVSFAAIFHDVTQPSPLPFEVALRDIPKDGWTGLIPLNSFPLLVSLFGSTNSKFQNIGLQ